MAQDQPVTTTSVGGMELHVTKLMRRPILSDEGGYLLKNIDEETFKALVSAMEEDDRLVENSFMATALRTLTGVDASLGMRTGPLKPGQVAVIFDIDLEGTFNSANMTPLPNTIDNIDFVRKNSKFAMLVKLDIEGIMNTIQADQESYQKFMKTIAGSLEKSQAGDNSGGKTGENPPQSHIQ